MILLDHKKQYFILIDNQGADFAQGCIYEGLEEVMNQFRQWATADRYEDPMLEDWTIGDCLTHWQFTLKNYQANDWNEVHGSVELNYKF